MGRESYETVSQRMPPAKLFALGELQRERSRSSPDPAPTTPVQPQADCAAVTATGPPTPSRDRTVNRGAVLLTLDRARARSAAAELHHSQRHLDIACKEFLSSEGKLLPFTPSTVTSLTPTSGEKAVWNHNPYSSSTPPPEADETPQPESPVAVAHEPPTTVSTDDEETREESMAAFLARRLNPDAMPWAPTQAESAPVFKVPPPLPTVTATIDYEPPPWWSCMPVIQREPARITNLRKRLQRMEQTKRRVAEGIPVDRRQLAALEFETEVREELQRWQSLNRAHNAPTEGQTIPAPSPVVTGTPGAQQRPPQVAQLWATAITIANPPAASTQNKDEVPAVHNPVSPLIGVLRTAQPESPWDKEIASTWTAPRKRVAISDEVEERAAEELPDTPPLTPVLPPAAPPVDETHQIFTKRKPKRQQKQQANENPTETAGNTNTTPAMTEHTDVVMALSKLNQQQKTGTAAGGAFHWRETPMVARPTPPTKQKKAASWN